MHGKSRSGLAYDSSSISFLNMSVIDMVLPFVSLSGISHSSIIRKKKKTTTSFSHSSTQFNIFFLSVYSHLLAHSLVAFRPPQQPCSFFCYANSPTKVYEGKYVHYRLRRLLQLPLTVTSKELILKKVGISPPPTS